MRGMVPLRLLSLTFSQLHHKQSFSLQVNLCLIERMQPSDCKAAAAAAQGKTNTLSRPMRCTPKEEHKKVEPTWTVDALMMTEQRQITQLVELPMS